MLPYVAGSTLHAFTHGPFDTLGQLIHALSIGHQTVLAVIVLSSLKYALEIPYRAR